MCWVCEQGKTLLINSGPGHDQMHLFTILCDPQKMPAYLDFLEPNTLYVLLVCVCSIKPNTSYDSACVLDVGDHPFIRHPSYISYRESRIRPATMVEEKVRAGYYLPRTDCSIELLRRIIASAQTSTLASREMKMFLRSIELPTIP